MTVDIQYYISFRCTAEWPDIYLHYFGYKVVFARNNDVKQIDFLSFLHFVVLESLPTLRKNTDCRYCCASFQVHILHRRIYFWFQEFSSLH